MSDEVANRSTIRKRDVAAFFLLPQFKYSFRHLSGAYSMMVNLLATIFIQAGLIDLNHPASKPSTSGHYTINWLLAEAWYNLRTSDNVDPHKWGLFGGVVAMIGLTVLTLLTLFLKIAFGTAAHAQLFSQPPGNIPSSPPLGGAPGTFHPDIAQDILNNVLRLAAETPVSPIQVGLGQALAVYSNGIMVIAAFIVFWIVLSLVADTARTGQLGGGKNMVWTPLRLVLALGLLVPFGNGFNSGQYIVLKLAEWGSNLGSNVWTAHVAGVMGSMNMVGLPQAPQVASAIGRFGEILTCRDAMNLQYMHYGGGTIPANLAIINRVPQVRNATNMIDGNGNPVIPLQLNVTRGFPVALPGGPGNLAGVTVLEMTWGNTQHPAACGGIKFKPVANIAPTSGTGVDGVVTTLQAQIYNLWTPYLPFGGGTTLGGGLPATVQEYLDPYACQIAANKFSEIDNGVNPAISAARGCIDGSRLAVVNVPASVPPRPNNFFNNVDPITNGPLPDTALTIQPLLMAYMNVTNGLAGNARQTLINQTRAAAGLTLQTYPTTTSTAAPGVPPAAPPGSVGVPLPPANGVPMGVVPQVSQVGWAGMGIWYYTIAQMNKRFGDAVSTLPEFTSPMNMSTVSVSGQVRDIYNKTRSAIDSYRIWWRAGSYSNNLAPNDPYYLQMSRDTSMAAGVPGTGLAGGEPPKCIEFFPGDGFWDKATNFVTGSGPVNISVEGCLAELGWDVSFGKELFDLVKLDGETYPMAALSAMGTKLLSVAKTVIIGATAIVFFAPTIDIGSSALLSMLTTLGYTLLMSGAFLVYYMPFIPFIRVTMAVLSWIFVVFEAVVAAPLFALAHLSAEGDGIAGPRAAQGYCFLLHLLIRPSMVVFGFIGSMIVFDSMVRMINDTFARAIGRSADVIDWIIYIFIYMFIIYGLVNATFKMVDMLPDGVMKWINCPASGAPLESGENIGEMFIAANQQGTQLTQGAMSTASGYRQQSQNKSKEDAAKDKEFLANTHADNQHAESMAAQNQLYGALTGGGGGSDTSIQGDYGAGYSDSFNDDDNY